MSLTSRNLNSALGACTPTKGSDAASASTARPSSSAPASSGGGHVEAIRVAVRLKPLSANADYDEIDPQIGRAWRVQPETNTIVQETALLADAALPGGAAAMGGGFVAAATPSKFGTPAKSRLNGGGVGGSLMAPPSTAGKHAQGKETTFTFDRVFGEDSTTSQIYGGMVKDIVDSVTEKGINGTVFAYGQTSSGKTFTMQGNRASAKNNPSRNGVDGITHMAARDIFATIAADPQHSYAVRVSFLEIYNEEVRDLLVAADGKSGAAGGGVGNGSNNGQKQATLAVREDPKSGVFVENLTSHRVYNLDTLLHYLNLGEKHKSVAATGMNDRSSRSHTIFRITVERKKKVVVQQSGGAGPAVSLLLTPPPETNGGGKKGGGKKSGSGGVKLVATLNLVDLAGSESVRHTGATGSRQKEGGKINQSLLTLSRVIMGLGKASSRKSGSSKTPFVNYRDSKLTRILQSSLSGNARMAVICCATLSDAYTEETKSTLQFASRAKLVKTRASANEIDEDPSVIKKLQREVAQRSEEGKQALRQLRELERQTKDAEKAKDDADKRLKKLYNFVRTSDTIHLLSQDREYGQVLSTRNCSYEPAVPALAKATPAKPFAKASLLDRRSTMKKQFSESLFVRTSLDGSEGSGTIMEGSVAASAIKSSFISPRYADTISTFDQPSTHVTLLKDALAAKTTQVRKLMEESNKVDEAALNALRKEIDVLQKKADHAVKEKEDALDWVEELHDKLEKAEREALDASDGKDVATAESEGLREEVERLKDIQTQSAGDSEKALADLRALYEEQNAKLQSELKEVKEKATKQERLFNSAKQDRDLMRERMERVSAERDEARTSARELQQQNTTLMESLDDLQVENDQALQIIEELTTEKQDLVAENESQQAQLKVLSQVETDHEAALKEVEAIQAERDDLLEQLSTVHSLVASKSPRNSESDGMQTLAIVEQLTDAMEREEALDSVCRRMTSENEDLREQLVHLNSSIQCQSDIAKSTEGELTAENLDLRDELAEVGKSAARAKASAQALEAEKDGLSNMLEASEAQTNDLKAAIDTLEGEKEELTSKIEASEIYANKLKVAIDTLEGEKEKLTGKLEVSEAQTNDLKAAIDTLEGEKDELSNMLEASDAQANELQAAIDTLEGEKDELSNMLEASDAQANELKAAIDTLEGEKDELSNMLEASEAQANELQAAIDTLEGEKEELTGKLGVSETQVKQLKAAIDTLEGEKGELSNKIEASEVHANELKAAIITLEGEKAELSNMLEASDAQANQLQATIDTLSSALEDSQSETQRTQNERDALNNDLSQARSQLKQTLADVEALRADLANQTEELEKSRANNKRLESEINSLERQRSELASTEKDLLSQVDEEKKNMRQQKEEVSTQLEELSGEYANTLGRLAVETEKVETLSREKTSLIETNKILVSKASALKNERDAQNVQISDVSSKLIAANEYKDELAEESKRILSVNSELSTKLNTAEEEVKSKTEKLEIVTKDLAATQDELETFLSRAREEVKAKEEKITQLSSELSMVNESLSAVRAEIDATGKSESKTKAIAIVEKTRLEHEVKNLRKQAASSEEGRMELETQYEEKCQAEAALRKHAAQLENNLANMSAQLEQTRSDLEAQQAAASQDEAVSQRLDAVSEENVTLQSQIDTLQNTVEALTSELSSVTKQLGHVKAEAEASTGSGTSSEEVDELRTTVKEQTRFLTSKDSEIRMLQSKLSKLHFERDDAVASMMRMRRESNSYLSRISALENQRKEESKVAGSKSTEMAKSLESLSETKTSLDREVARLEQQKADAERLAKRVRRESSSTAIKCRELQNALEHANECKEELEDRIRQYEQLIGESDKDHDRMVNERKTLIRAHSREIGTLKKDKQLAERECHTLMQRMEDMCSRLDFLEAEKNSAEAAAARLLEQKHRALNRLDTTVDQTSRTIRAVENQRKIETERERRLAQMRLRAIQAEKENEIKARDTKLGLYESERNSLGKTTKRSLSLVGREAKRGLAVAREKGSNVLRSRSNL